MSLLSSSASKQRVKAAYQSSVFLLDSRSGRFYKQWISRTVDDSERHRWLLMDSLSAESSKFLGGSLIKEENFHITLNEMVSNSFVVIFWFFAINFSSSVNTTPTLLNISSFGDMRCKTANNKISIFWNINSLKFESSKKTWFSE